MTERMLSPHFALAEFTISQEGSRAGIDNTPSDEVIIELMQLANSLEQVRVVLGDQAIHIDSGYRCPLVNHLVGGALNSAHLYGRAADILCPAFGSPVKIAKAIIAAGIVFDQLIFEGTWVHFAQAAPGDEPRREVLTAVFRPGQKTAYLPGLPTTPSA